MAHLLHLKGVIWGIVFPILVLWGAEGKNEKCFEQIFVSQDGASLNGDGKGELWAGLKKIVSFGFMKTAMGTGEAQGLWLFLPFFRRFPVAPLLCTS